MPNELVLEGWEKNPVVQVGESCVAASFIFGLEHHGPCMKVTGDPWNSVLGFMQPRFSPFPVNGKLALRKFGVASFAEVRVFMEKRYSFNIEVKESISFDDKINIAISTLEKGYCCALAFNAKGLKRYAEMAERTPGQDSAHAMPLIKVDQDRKIFTFRDLNFPCDHPNKVYGIDVSILEDLHNNQIYKGYGRDILFFKK